MANEKKRKTFADRMSDKAKEKYAELFTSALDAMEKSDWQKPWVQKNNGVPCNLYRKSKPYKGCNHFLLTLLGSIMGYETPYYLTYHQLTNKPGDLKYGKLNINRVVQTNADGTVKITDDGMPMISGERSFPVYLWLPKHKDKDGNMIKHSDYLALSEEEQEECKTWFSMNVYDVWNIDQLDFKEQFPEVYEQMTQVKGHEYQHGQKDEVLERMIMQGDWRCKILFGGNSAHYSPTEDHIRLPQREKFNSDEVFYGTAIHEMAHSTAKELKRAQPHIFGTEAYAKEEFIAELTAASVCSILGVGKLLDEQHLSYVDGWRKAIRSDKNFIPLVIDDVQRATNYILARYDEVNKRMHPLALPLAA